MTRDKRRVKSVNEIEINGFRVMKHVVFIRLDQSVLTPKCLESPRMTTLDAKTKKTQMIPNSCFILKQKKLQQH